MKKQLLILTLLAMVLLAMVPVQAMTITMANPGSIAERDIIVYYPNGTMQGYYNSTSVITLDTSSDYIFTLKPLGANPVDDPGNFLTTMFSFLLSNAIPIVFVILILGLYYNGRRR